MSVQANTYVMRGVLRPYSEFKGRHDELEPYMDSAFKGVHHHNGVCVLFDGMNGKYVAIGRVLAKTGNHEGFEEPLKIKTGLHDDVELQDAIEALVGTVVTVDDFVLTHYR